MIIYEIDGLEPRRTRTPPDMMRQAVRETEKERLKEYRTILEGALAALSKDLKNGYSERRWDVAGV